MTNHLDKTSTILGFPAAKLQAALHSWERSGKRFDDLAGLSQVSVAPGVAAAFMGEALARKLVGFVDEDMTEDEDGRLGLTKEGMALVAATKRGRTPKSKAAPVVEALLNRAQALMQDNIAPVNVEKIWLFGSFIDPEKDDVGDIDIVIESYRTGVVPFRETYRYVHENYPGMLPKSRDMFQRLGAGETFLAKSVFGPRKHPLLAPNDIDTLESLHRPCAVVFDRSMGGKIEPIHYDHHPESTGRADHIREKLVLPDLDAHLKEFEMTSPFILDYAFGRSSRRGAFDHLNWRAISGETTSDAFNLQGTREKSLEIKRSVDFSNNAWNLTLTVAVTDPHREKDFYAWYDLALQLTALAHADIVRLADKREKQETMQMIFADIEFPGLKRDHPMRAAVDRLITRLVVMAEERPFISPRHDFNIDFTCDRNGVSLTLLDEMDDDEWAEAADTLPFSKGDYLAWVDTVGGDIGWSR